MKKVIPVVFIVLLLITGCGGGPIPANQQGSISLTIASPDFTVKTIQPNIDMTIATYDVYGTGPSVTNFRKNAVTGNNVTIDALVTGEWTITVDAKNKDGIIIASGLSLVTVVNGQTVTANVTVEPLSGTGALKLGLSWPSGTISNPIISATLTPKGGSASTINFNLGSDNISATYQNTTINAGYYTLLVYLYDGTSFKWGAVEAVRILAGQTSEGNYPIIPGAGFGGINLIITPDLQNPIKITFSGQQETLMIGNSMSITATTSEPVENYQWYLNGWLLNGETNSSITIGSSLGASSYRLDLVVTKGNIISSSTVNFKIEIPTVFSDHFETLQRPPWVVEQYLNTHGANAGVSGSKLIPTNFGSGNEWHGPQVIRNFQSLGDFDFKFIGVNIPYSSDNMGECRLQIWSTDSQMCYQWSYNDAWESNISNNLIANYFFINGNTLAKENKTSYIGDIRIKRVGHRIFFYRGNILIYEGDTDPAPVGKVCITFEASDGYPSKNMSLDAIEVAGIPAL